MFVERLLQINVAALAALGALLLGMDQRSAALPLGVIVAAAASIVITDVTGWFRLNKVVTNLAAGVAVVVAVWELFRPQGVERVLAIANLLVYLQIILLFQEKRVRTYQQIALLSLLEVIVVATVFDHGFFFGLMLVIYMFMGLSALSLLSLHRDRSRHELKATPTGNGGGASGPSPAALFRSDRASAGDREGVGRELWTRLARIAAGTVVLTLVVFITLPRFGRGAWRGVATKTRRAVGFDDRVRLGELGSVIEDPTEILRAEFVDYRTGEPCPVVDSVYLRGAVLNRYRGGEWQFRRAYDPMGHNYSSVPTVDSPPPEGLVVGHYTIEPMDREELFAIWPIEGVEEKRDLRIFVDNYRRRLIRGDEWRRRRLTYRVGTTTLEQGWQEDIVPCREKIDRQILLQMPPVEGPDALPSLAALADEWVKESATTPDDPYGCARVLERNLRDSDRFGYTLEGIGGLRDPAIDPIEDFVRNHPRGHCEYFATALVLMLRSQGIPARMAVGYRCDEWNPLGEFYQVRQLHAHTWVEVYLEPIQIPTETVAIEDRRRWQQGAWLRLDPTPAAEDVEPGAAAAVLKRMDSYLTWLDYVWDNYVMEMDSPRQQKAVYEPAARWVRGMSAKMCDPKWWGRQFRRLGGAAHGLWMGVIEGRWFNWRGGLTAVIVLVCLLAAWRAIAALVRRVRRRHPGRAGAAVAGARAKVEFYRRLETLLARRGLSRSAGQTQRQFARAVGWRIARATGDAELAGLPEAVAEAFYRVRFGGESLGEPERADVEGALVRLGDAVGGGGEW